MHIRHLFTISLLLSPLALTGIAKNRAVHHGIYSLAAKTDEPSEDRYFAMDGYYGLFDGHKGTFVAQYLADNLLQQLKICLENVELAKDIRRIIARTFFDIDNKMRLDPNTPPLCGAPGAVIVLKPQDVYIAHIGSTRVFVLGKNSRFWKSRNHEVRERLERDRIRREQGLVRTASTKEYVLIDDCSKGICTIHKRASRSFGDFYLREDGTLAKPRGLSVVPEIKKFHRKNVSAIIMITDGIWRPYGDADGQLGPLEDLFRKVLKSDMSPTQIAETVVKEVRKKVVTDGCKLDDMTAIVIRLT